jgi:hypothetical protein
VPNEARAIPVEALSTIWKEMPLDLINNTRNEKDGKTSIPVNAPELAPEKINIWKVIICIVIIIILVVTIINEIQRQKAVMMAEKQDAIFKEAIEEINSQDLKVRVSGIEKMEEIFNDSKEKQWRIIRILARSITINHPAPKPLNKGTNQTEPAEDVNKSLSIIKKPKIESTKESNEIITLKESDLYGVNLMGAQLPNVDFNRSYLYQSNLSNANLKNAHFSGAYLRLANLKGTDLRGADLRGADLFKANLEGADFTDEQIMKACHWEKADYEIGRLQKLQKRISKISRVRSECNNSN